MGDMFQAHRSADRPCTWHMVTGEYPPDSGGVADYTVAVADALAETGAEVHVWSTGDEPDAVPLPGGVTVHRVAGRFGPAGLARMDRELNRFPDPRTILIQYVPHAFGWKAMNMPFVAWVLIRRVRWRDDVRVMFHEVAFPRVRRPIRHNVLALVNRAMAAVLVRACTRAYVTIPGWIPLLRQLGAGRLPITWTPVSSSVPEEASTSAVAARRTELTMNDPTVRLICHFGTYGPSVSRALGPVVRELLDRRPEVRVVLLRGRRRPMARRAGRWTGGLVCPHHRPRLAARPPDCRVPAGLRPCDPAVP